MQVSKAFTHSVAHINSDFQKRRSSIDFTRRNTISSYGDKPKVRFTSPTVLKMNAATQQDATQQPFVDQFLPKWLQRDYKAPEVQSTALPYSKPIIENPVSLLTYQIHSKARRTSIRDSGVKNLRRGDEGIMQKLQNAFMFNQVDSKARSYTMDAPSLVNPQIQSKNHPNLPEIFLEGPFNIQKPDLDMSYGNMTQEMLDMEKAIPLDRIFAQSKDELKDQFQSLQTITKDQIDDVEGTYKFDKTAVKLIKWKPTESEYINASYVKTVHQEANDTNLNSPYGLMIAAEAPNNKTIEQYWKMIVQENVTRIISLCDATMDDCCYFPKSASQPMISNTKRLDYMVFLDDKKTEETPHYIKRHFEIHMQRHSDENIPNIHQIHNVQHIQFKTWSADEEVPKDIEVQNALQKMTEQQACFLKLQRREVIPEKLVAHCGDGKERTGMFLTMVNSMLAIKGQKDSENEKKLSLFSVVRRLREQRSDVISNQTQYDFVFDQVKEWHNQKKLEAV